MDARDEGGVRARNGYMDRRIDCSRLNMLNFSRDCAWWSRNTAMTALVEKAAGDLFTQPSAWPASVAPADGFRYYRVYGMCLRSQIELSLPQHAPSHGREIEVLDQSACFFSNARGGAALERSSLSRE